MITRDVLHVGPLPPPYGGVAVMAQWTMRCRQLKDFNHLPFDFSRKESWEVVGKKSLDPRRVMRRLWLAASLARQASRLRPSLVHFHCGSGGRWDFIGDMLLLAAARRGGAPVLFHWHRDTTTAVYPGKGKLTQSFFRHSAGACEALAVLLEEYRPPLAHVGVGEKVHVIPNSFEPSLLDLPIRGDRGDPIQIAYIGRLSQEKGFFDLVGAIRQLSSSEKIPKMHFSAAGAADPAAGGLGGIRERLERSEIGDRVTLLGPVAEAGKVELLSRADLLVLPSHRESFGIAALEAMAAGLPVVAYDIGRLREIVGEAGWLVREGDVEGLVAALGELASNAARRREMGELGRKRARQRFGPERVGADLRQIYEQLTARQVRTS